MMPLHIPLTYGEFAWMVLVVFGAYVARGMSGFGAGILATPLLAFILPMRIIVPLNALLILGLFVFLTIRDWRKVVWGELKLLIPPTLGGIVLALLLFKSLDNRGLLTLLGGFLVIYAIYMLVVNLFGLPELKCSTKWAFPTGVLGSFIDTLFGGGGGSFVVIYVHGRGLTGMAFRATLVALWLIEMLARLAGYGAVGFYNAQIVVLVLAMLPFVAVATWVGERVGDRVNPRTFSKIIAVMLLLSGLSLLMR